MRYKAGIIQLAIKRGEIEVNKQVAFEKIKQLVKENTQLIILPELWATGFAYKELPALANLTPELIKEIQGLLPEGVVVACTLPQQEGRHIYNTAFLVSNKDILARYQKLHLFSPMQEDKHFAKGRRWVVVSTPLGQIGLLICYDLRFPELARRLVLEGAEVLIVCAAWPQMRIEHWQILLRARAIENQVFILAANACGQQGRLKMGGHSAIISPWGEVLAKAGKEETVLMAEIDLEKVEEARRSIPCLQDRRSEVYHE